MSCCGDCGVEERGHREYELWHCSACQRIGEMKILVYRLEELMKSAEKLFDKKGLTFKEDLERTAIAFARATSERLGYRGK